MSNPPSVTLYVSNLNDKVAKKDEIRRTLYALFSLYGKVLDVVHMRGKKARGTAFVVFRDLAAATAAMRGLDGEGFFGKQLRISYGKSVSHATIAQNEGAEAVYAIKLGLKTASEKKAGGTSRLTVSGAQRKQIDEANKAKRAREDENGSGEEMEDDSDEEEGDAAGEPSRKKGKKSVEQDDDAMEEDDSDDEAAAAAAAPVAPAQGDDPNPILFLEGLPLDLTSDMLLPLFQQYPGLSSLKLLPVPVGASANSGSAFVQYETAKQAGTAKEALNDFKLAPEVTMRVSWAKRG